MEPFSIKQFGRGHTVTKGWAKIIKLGQTKKSLFIQLHTENRSRKSARAGVGGEERNAVSFNRLGYRKVSLHLPRQGNGLREERKTGEGASKINDCKAQWPDLSGTGLRQGCKVRKKKGGEEGGVPSPAFPQLTKHEYRTMAHHGGAMQSRVPRAGGTSRTFWRERTSEAQKTLPPQGSHANPLLSGSPPITAPTSLTGTHTDQLTFLDPPPT